MPNFSVAGNAKAQGVWLGINIVAEPNEETDKYDLDYVKNFIGKKAILTTMDYRGKRHVEKFIVSDVVSSKGYFDDKTLYMPLNTLRKIDEKDFVDNSTNFIKLKLKNRTDTQKTATKIKDLWYQYSVEELKKEPKTVSFLNFDTRDSLYQNIFDDLRNQLTVVTLMFGVICSVAVLLIFCIFYMIVTTRQKDIAIIKSCGASSLSAASIFTGFGVCIGIIGSILGVILAIVVTNNVNILEEWVRIIFGIKLWRTSSYGLTEIPHQVHWPVVAPVVLAAIAGCIIGVLIPSIIAARTKPVKILRYE
jgi:ABC-type lipoprotein release transport system permease subunit